MTLRAMRESLALTQEQAASKTGLSQPAISALELGRVPNPGIETVAKLATAYGAPVDVVIDALRETVAEAAA